MIALDCFRDFVKDKCDNQLQPLNFMNLSKLEEKGRKEIIKGIKEKDWYLYSTDKSGKLVLDTIENYAASMQEHFIDTEQVTYEIIWEAEK